jgi:hypothetical protein
MDLDSDRIPTKEKIESLTVEQLKVMCKAKGIKVSGKKSDIITRLLNPEPPPKGKRPDLKTKGHQKKGTLEKVIKKSLIGALKKKQLYPVITQWVSNASKTMNRASLLFNRFLIHCLSNDLELPDFSLDPMKNTTTQNFFNHCIKIGNFKANTTFEIQAVWDQYFQSLSFPVHTPKIGEPCSNTWIAKNYSTMFYNSLECNFESRQKRYIRHWLEQNNLNKDWIHQIQCAVNGWNCRTQTQLPLEVEDFIQTQRQILDPPQEGITDTWLKEHRNAIIRYFWVILKYLETIETAKKFNLAPIHSISSHFLMIDTPVLFYMSKEAGLIPKDSKVNEFKTDNYRDIFKFKESERYRFSEKIQTDGVSICFHYRIKPKDRKETPEEKYERIIGIDPGRSNLIFGVEKTSKGLKTYRLTRNEYYCASGMNKRTRQAFKWQKHIHSEEQTFSQVSPKTTNPEQWDSFLRNYISVYNKLWEAKTGKKWARARFRVFGLKKKVIDRFFKQMKGPVKPLICFGSAKFKPNGKGELSAPTTSIFKACERRFKVELVDEFRTTRICVDCDHILSPVMGYTLRWDAHMKLGDFKEIRGLRRCGSSECSQISYKNRDLNAALNILRCYSNDSRPKILSRESSEGALPKEKPWYLSQIRYARNTKPGITCVHS